MDNPRVIEENVVSLCPLCLERIEATKVVEGQQVYLHKTCPVHGPFKCLLEDNASYYEKRYEFDKAGSFSKTQTVPRKGCPCDCGLCTEHKQHTCIALIEITTACNLSCPACYANSGPATFLDLSKIERMVDFLIEAEGGEAEIIQISGGEPTLHPELIAILRMIKAKKVKYLMLNTNGLVLARDQELAKALAALGSGFEVYLQFDGLDKAVHERMRGQDLLEIKKAAIKNLSACHIPITLVSTVEKGMNEDQVGAIFEFGLNTSWIRGINFQPVAYFGRGASKAPAQRTTLTGVMALLEEQSKGMVRSTDFIPLPCNVERVAISYLYREKNGFVPIARKVDFRKYLPAIKNTFNFNANEMLSEALRDPGLFGCACLDFFKDIRGLIPLGYARKSAEEKACFINENVFRVSVTSFVDAYNFDIKSVQKECVHVVTPDCQRIPFSMYNLLYRDQYGNNKHS